MVYPYFLLIFMIYVQLYTVNSINNKTMKNSINNKTMKISDLQIIHEMDFLAKKIPEEIGSLNYHFVCKNDNNNNDKDKGIIEETTTFIRFSKRAICDLNIIEQYPWWVINILRKANELHKLYLKNPNRLSNLDFDIKMYKNYNK